MQATSKRKKAKSPYQKYGKAPYLYSGLYQEWRAAVTAGRKDEADRIGRQHTSRFAYGSGVHDAGIQRRTEAA